VAILAQSSADFALRPTYNFQGSHILGASRGHLCNRWLLVTLRRAKNVLSLEAFVAYSVASRGKKRRSTDTSSTLNMVLRHVDGR